MHRKRTTVAAPADSLETLEREADRRSVSLNTILAEAVEQKAAEIRSGRRPRVGLGRSTDGEAARELASEPVARPPS